MAGGLASDDLDLGNSTGPSDSARLIGELVERGLTVAVAESLTGGLLAASLIAVPGASAAVNGAVVVYNTELKASILWVDENLLDRAGPVDAEVARQLARNVRVRLAVSGRPADVGIATTGVAGPDPVGEFEPGIVFLGLSIGELTRARKLFLQGSRNEIRVQAVAAAIEWMLEALELGLSSFAE